MCSCECNQYVQAIQFLYAISTFGFIDMVQASLSAKTNLSAKNKPHGYRVCSSNVHSFTILAYGFLSVIATNQAKH